MPLLFLNITYHSFNGGSVEDECNGVYEVDTYVELVSCFLDFNLSYCPFGFKLSLIQIVKILMKM